MYTPEELAQLIRSKLAPDLGPIHDLRALARVASGRIYRLKITRQRDYVILGKELEIRRALSSTHLYSSAFVIDLEAGRFVLRGGGTVWVYARSTLPSWQMQATLSPESSNTIIVEPVLASSFRDQRLRFRKRLSPDSRPD